MIRLSHARMGATIAIVVLCAAAAQAWGPRTQTAVVTTAMQLVSREQSLPLTKLENDVRAGVSASAIAMEELYPEMTQNPLRAIESEMALLTAVKGARIDGYFAYRLGALGKLVGRATAPLSLSEPALRNQYYEDADGAIASISLTQAPRKVMESMAQLERIIREANANNDLIESEYRGGAGFRGAAAAKFTVDASRSVNAVADVWWTLISARTLPGNISEEQLRRYVLSGFDYYIARGNMTEIEAAKTNYAKLVPFTPDMHARLGDMLYAANFREQAVREYEAVLAVTTERRDVVEKIGKYYEERAEEALEKNLLEDALAGFARALEVNPLHPDAEAKRLAVADMIVKRDAQQAEYRAALKQADDLRQLAEEEASRNRFAEAIALLQQAEAAYVNVGDEFPLEAQQRTRGAREVQARAAELKRSMLGNALAFSGAGFGPDMDQILQESDRGLDQEALTAMLETEFKAEIQRLSTQLQPLLTIE